MAVPTSIPEITRTPNSAPINKDYPLAWSTVTGTGNTYTLEECKDSNCNYTSNLSATSINLNYAYTGTRTYRVKACDSSGCGSYGNLFSIEFYGPPWQTVTPSGPESMPLFRPYTISWASVSNASYYALEECKGSSCNITNIDLGQYSQNNGYVHRGHEYTGTRNYRVKACNEAGCANFAQSTSVTTVQISNNIKSALIYTGYGNGEDEGKIDWSFNQPNLDTINKLDSAGVNRLIIAPTSHLSDSYYSMQSNSSGKLLDCTPDETPLSASENFNGLGVNAGNGFQKDVNDILALVKASNNTSNMKVWISTPAVKPDDNYARYIPTNTQIKSWLIWLKAAFINDWDLIDGIYMFDENFPVCKDAGNPMLEYFANIRKDLMSDASLQKLNFVWAPDRSANYKEGEVATTGPYSKVEELITGGLDSSAAWDLTPILNDFSFTPLFDYIFMQPNVYTQEDWAVGQSSEWDGLLAKISSWVSSQSIYSTPSVKIKLGIDMEIDRIYGLDPEKRQRYETYEDNFSNLVNSRPMLFYFHYKHNQAGCSFDSLVDKVSDFYTTGSSSPSCYSNAGVLLPVPTNLALQK